MLLIPTYVAPSKIDGLGLFAAEPLTAGTVWWRLDERVDRIFSDDEFHTLPPLVQLHIVKSGYCQDGKRFMCGDDARFVNHSTNTPSRPIAEYHGSIFIRDVMAGEEITEDYTQFDVNVRPFMRAA